MATACPGTDVIRPESPEGTICDALIFAVPEDGSREQGGSGKDPHHPISVRQLGYSSGCPRPQWEAPAEQ